MHNEIAHYLPYEAHPVFEQGGSWPTPLSFIAKFYFIAQFYCIWYGIWMGPNFVQFGSAVLVLFSHSFLCTPSLLMGRTV